MDEAARICARLIAAGTVPRRELPAFDHPEIRAEVEERLRHCGLQLATSAYRDEVGLRLATEASDATVLDASSNLNLNSDACALITILWSRLALPYRTVADTHETPDAQPNLFVDERSETARRFTPTVRFETLSREFGAQLGGKVRLKGLLAQLRRLGFVHYHRLDDIEAGPLLELAIDGARMASFIRTRVLSQLLQPKPPSEGEAPREPTAADQVIAALSDNKGPLSMAELERRTGLSRTRLRQTIDQLREERRVEKLGGKANAQYRLAGEEGAD